MVDLEPPPPFASEIRLVVAAVEVEVRELEAKGRVEAVANFKVGARYDCCSFGIVVVVVEGMEGRTGANLGNEINNKHNISSWIVVGRRKRINLPWRWGYE